MVNSTTTHEQHPRSIHRNPTLTSITSKCAACSGTPETIAAAYHGETSEPTVDRTHLRFVPAAKCAAACAAIRKTRLEVHHAQRSKFTVDNLANHTSPVER